MMRHGVRLGVFAVAAVLCAGPAAAMATLESRHENLAFDDEEADFRQFVFESADDRTDDEHPTPPVESAERTLADSEQRRLRELGRLAKTLVNSANDTKLNGCAELVAGIRRGNRRMDGHRERASALAGARNFADG